MPTHKVQFLWHSFWRRWQAPGVYTVLALLVLAPLLRPGFILTVDMVFTPVLRWPDHVTNTYPFFALLHFLNIAIPADVLQKLLVLVMLVLAGCGGHLLARLVMSPQKGGIPVYWYVAGMLYMFNPFVYDRFMAGQYLVVAGYALLPWVARALLQFWQQPSWSRATWMSVLSILVSIVSIHSVGFVALLALVSIGVYGYRHPQRRQALVMLAGSTGIFLLGASFWLVPTLMGKGEIARSVASFTQVDANAFATLGGTFGERLLNVLQMQGFWQEGRSLFTLPQAIMPIWALGMLFLWVMVVWGGYVLWQQNRRLCWFFGTVAIVAVLAASGAGHGWIAGHIPFFAGYREPQKFAALLALCYVIFAAGGAQSLVTKLQAWPTSQALVKGAVFLLPFALAPTMLWGFAGQLSPRQYPAGWATVNEELRRDDEQFNVLFLPWHHYMSFGFAGRLIANPAPDFFDKPMIISQDPEVGGLTARDPPQQALTRLVASAPRHAHSHLGALLLPYKVKYIVVAKELDYQQYDYLDTNPDFRQVKNTNSIMLYRNLEFKGE